MTKLLQIRRARRLQLLIALGARQHPSRRIKIALGLLIFFVSEVCEFGSILSFFTMLPKIRDHITRQESVLRDSRLYVVATVS